MGDIVGIAGDVIGGVALLNPGVVAGLDLWVAADAFDPSLADGTPIGVWPDLSGNLHSLLQPTAGLQPLYKVNVKNGHPVLRFDGANDYMAGPITASQLRTLFFVLKKATAPAAGDKTGWSTIPTNFDKLITNTAFSATLWGKYGNQAGNTVAINAIAVNWNLLTFNFSSLSVLSMFVNGSAQAAYDPLDGYATQTGLQIGTDSGKTNYGDEDVAEVIVYDRSLSVPEMVTVHAYLDNKYAIY